MALGPDKGSYRKGRRLRPRRAVHEGNPRTSSVRLLEGQHPDPWSAGRGPREVCSFQRAGGRRAPIGYVVAIREKTGRLLTSMTGIKEFSDWPTIPQLYIENEFVGGCDILVSMHQDGSLAKMLEEKNVLAAAEGADGESKQ